MRMGHQQFFRTLECRHCLFPSNRRKMSKELFEGVACSQIIEKCLYWHASPQKNRNTAKDFRIAVSKGFK